jgi:branched-chain amino acid transport system substrate-binding protein
MKNARIIFIIGLVIVLISNGCKEKQDPKPGIKTIKIAGLFSETGGLSYLGLTSEEAIKIAIGEINKDYENRSIPYRFELTVFDTKIDANLALDAMRTIGAGGFKLVIGPQTSAELIAIKPIADSLGIMGVSPSSTTSLLSVPNDMVFRYAPGEQIVGEAMAKSIYLKGKRALVCISRNDAGSLGLNNAISSNFKNQGGVTVSAGNFNGTDVDFTAVLSEVNKQINNYAKTYSKSQIGVLSTSFDETILLFKQANSDTTLSSVNWYGGVGFFKNNAITTNTAASQFAVNTKFFSPGFSLPNSASKIWSPLLTKIKTKTGLDGDALTLNSYDIMRVFGIMVEAQNGLPATPELLRLAFLNASNQHSGATGPIMLNANGDRANGTFDYWGLQNNNGNFQWYFVGQSK